MVRSSSDFFVAGRSLGPGLILSSMLAANIGAGATVNAAGLGYRDGLSAWWWSGSAGLASLVLAFWVGPRLWALAKTHGFYTTGDFLEYRYGPAVRGIISVLVTFGCLWILAAQLMAGAAILNVHHRRAALARLAHRRRHHDGLLRRRRPARHGAGSTRCSWS